MIASTIDVPHTYSEWVTVFEMLKNKEDDELVLQVMKKGTIEWQSGVSERFTRRLIDIINYRMNEASDKFQKQMSRSSGREREIVNAIFALRKEMCFLSEAVNIPAIPEKDRKQYISLVIEQADNMQNSLENSAKKDRSGKLASIVRNNRVNSFYRG